MSTPKRRASCAHPTLDADKRAKICNAPATAERVIEGVRLPLCDAHAAEHDARTRATTSMPKALDWTDRAACESWLNALDTAAKDLEAVGEDQTRDPADRDLGRRAARRMHAEAAHSVESLIAFARAGLAWLARDDDPPSGDPAGSGGSPAH